MIIFIIISAPASAEGTRGPRLALGQLARLEPSRARQRDAIWAAGPSGRRTKQMAI